MNNGTANLVHNMDGLATLVHERNFDDFVRFKLPLCTDSIACLIIFVFLQLSS